MTAAPAPRAADEMSAKNLHDHLSCVVAIWDDRNRPKGERHYQEGAMDVQVGHARVLLGSIAAEDARKRWKAAEALGVTDFHPTDELGAFGRWYVLEYGQAADHREARVAEQFKSWCAARRASGIALDAPQVYAEAARKLRARPDAGNVAAVAALLEDVAERLNFNENKETH